MTDPKPTTVLDEVLGTRLSSSIWNPVTSQKLRSAAWYLSLRPGAKVLDLGCGTGTMLCDWACRWQIQGVGVDVNPDFCARAERQAVEHEVTDLLSFIVGDLGSRELPEHTYDAVTCIGAADALGGYPKAIERMSATVVRGGGVAIGDVFHRGLDEPLAIAAEHQLRLAGLVVASPEDWDGYYSAQWSAALAWARERSDHPDREWLLDRMAGHQRRYLHDERGSVTWAVLAFVRA